MPSLQQFHSNSTNDSTNISMVKLNLERNNLLETIGTELLQKHSINSIIEQRQDFLSHSYNSTNNNNNNRNSNDNIMDDIVYHNNDNVNTDTFPLSTITSIMNSVMLNDLLNLTESGNAETTHLTNVNNLRLKDNILSNESDIINVGSVAIAAGAGGGGGASSSLNNITNLIKTTTSDCLTNAMDIFLNNDGNNIGSIRGSNYMPLTPSSSTQSSISPITSTANSFDIFPFGNIAPPLSSSSPQQRQKQQQQQQQQQQESQLQLSDVQQKHLHRQLQSQSPHQHTQALLQTQQQQSQSQQQLQQQQSVLINTITTPPISSTIDTMKTKTNAMQQLQHNVFHRNVSSFDCSTSLPPTTTRTSFYNNYIQNCSPLVSDSSNSSFASGLSLDPLSLTYQNVCRNNNKANNNSSIHSTRSTSPDSQNSHHSNENGFINIAQQLQQQQEKLKQKQQYLEQQILQQQQQQSLPLPLSLPSPQIQSLLHNSINQLNESLLNTRNYNDNGSSDTYLDRIAKFHRGSAAFREPTCTWSGQLPPSTHRLHQFSPKVFLGGIPWDISEESLIQIFKPFGQIKVEWPGKEHLAAQPKGYVYVIFESDKQVKSLLSACIVQMDDQYNSSGIFYFKISSRRIKAKDVEVIPWWIGDSNYVKSTSQKLDPTKTVFVGALHGKLTAEGLAKVMDDLFDGVVYAGIDTDKYKYPIGSGRVTFNNNRSYMKAVSAAFIEIRTTKFTKKVQIDPYLEDSLCSMCGVQHGPYYCRELSCFRYFCRTCWQWQHSTGDVKFHKPLTRNAKTQTLIGLGPTMSALSLSFGLNSPNTLNYNDKTQQQLQQMQATQTSQSLYKQLNAARSLNSLETIIPVQQQQYCQQQKQQQQQDALCAAITSTAQKLQNLQNQLRL